MSDLPKSVHIKEEGPREGFQIEKGLISTARKIELIVGHPLPGSVMKGGNLDRLRQKIREAA